MEPLILLKLLKPQYFWDVDIEKMDINRSKRLIVERIYSLGSIYEINLINDYYGEESVLEVLKNLNYIDPKTLNFISKLFNEPLQSFKCFTRTPLTARHWNS